MRFEEDKQAMTIANSWRIPNQALDPWPRPLCMGAQSLFSRGERVCDRARPGGLGDADARPQKSMRVCHECPASP